MAAENAGESLQATFKGSFLFCLLDLIRSLAELTGDAWMCI